jgi:hypothetical protein
MEDKRGVQIIELQRIPYSTRGMWDLENIGNHLDWDNKNINPLRDLLHKAEKELGELTNPYEGLLTEKEKEQDRREAYRKERRTGQDGFQLGKNLGFSCMTLKDLKELRNKVPNKFQFDLRLKKLIEIEIAFRKRYNAIKELPKDYEWGENHLDMFAVDRWLREVRGGEVKMLRTYTSCPITFMVYAQNKQPKEFEQLDNEKFIDENGLELWGWCNPFKDVGHLKQCHSYAYFKSDDKYLILISQGTTTEHKWLKDGCVADYGGSWGSGGCIQQYQDLLEWEKEYRELNEGKSDTCLKGFSKIFMTERAWAVAKLMKEKKTYIPKSDFKEQKTIKDKADTCIGELDDYYLFLYPERNENNSHYSFTDLRFWIVKAYGEERFEQEYEKAKKRQLPNAFNSEESSLHFALRCYIDGDGKYARGWIKHSIQDYTNLKRIANEMGKSIKTFNEYKEEVREEIKQKIAEKLKKEISSGMAKIREEKLMSKSLNIDEELETAEGVV